MNSCLCETHVMSRERERATLNLCFISTSLLTLYWKWAINSSRTFYSPAALTPSPFTQVWQSPKPDNSCNLTLSKVQSCITSEPCRTFFSWTITVMNWRNIGRHRKTQGVKGWLTPLPFQPTSLQSVLI